MATKTQREDQAISLFRIKLVGFPAGVLTKSEAPDFLVHAPKRTIGIEVRHLYKESKDGVRPLQAVESQVDKIIARAAELANESGMPPVDVSLFHNDSLEIQEREIRYIAEQLFAFVQRCLPEVGQSVEWQYYDGRRCGQPQQFDQIWISRKYAKCPLWKSFKAALVQQECRSLFQAAIDEKATRLSAYLEKCSECWLLLSANALKPSGSIHPGDPSLEHIYQSPFARTFFLDEVLQKVHELKVLP